MSRRQHIAIFKHKDEDLKILIKKSLLSDRVRLKIDKKRLMGVLLVPSVVSYSYAKTAIRPEHLDWLYGNVQRLKGKPISSFNKITILGEPVLVEVSDPESFKNKLTATELRRGFRVCAREYSLLGLCLFEKDNYKIVNYLIDAKKEKNQHQSLKKVSPSKLRFVSNRASGEITSLRKLLKEVLRTYAWAYIHVVVEALNSLGYQVKCHKLSIRDSYTRWGSCSTNKQISLHVKLLFAPLWVLNYVIAHEVCHLVHFNHSPDFWELMVKLCPFTEQARVWLKEHGDSLHSIEFS